MITWYHENLNGIIIALNNFDSFMIYVQWLNLRVLSLLSCGYCFKCLKLQTTTDNQFRHCMLEFDL